MPGGKENEFIPEENEFIPDIDNNGLVALPVFKNILIYFGQGAIDPGHFLLKDMGIVWSRPGMDNFGFKSPISIDGDETRQPFVMAIICNSYRTGLFEESCINSGQCTAAARNGISCRLAEK